MSLFNIIHRMVIVFEDHIVNAILRQPGFHRAVGKIQRTVDDQIHGRNPNEPLRPGEATSDPNAPTSEGFLKHFVSELRNQASGRPTDLDEEPTKLTKKR
ncbi:hypothetical protein VHEMI10335 [[Torrubiella] hemipterigena]|uniref:Uncharacterized protein n=1 Tax=[Torrubiella] hemipterigena TaxID=1531966 RepID=A0A0A1TS00_9HYPO|nr:hypothetical protein VHEMI10335 [[Torrubiella] hemipterigena]